MFLSHYNEMSWLFPAKMGMMYEKLCNCTSTWAERFYDPIKGFPEAPLPILQGSLDFQPFLQAYWRPQSLATKGVRFV